MGACGSKSKFDSLKDSRTIMYIRENKIIKDRRNDSNYVPRAPFPPPKSVNKIKRPIITCTEVRKRHKELLRIYYVFELERCYFESYTFKYGHILGCKGIHSEKKLRDTVSKMKKMNPIEHTKITK